MKFTGKKKSGSLDTFKAKLTEKNAIGSMDKILGGSGSSSAAPVAGPSNPTGKFSIEIAGITS